MIDTNILLNLPIPVDIPEGVKWNKEKFKGLFVQNYQLKHFLVKEIGYEKYMHWIASIVTTPKDVADILWVKCNVYYKDINDWEFALREVFECINKGQNEEESTLIQALKFTLGLSDYKFVLKENKKGKNFEERFSLDIYDKDTDFNDLLGFYKKKLFTINYDVFKNIREVVKKINYIRPTELSKWRYAFDKHEKRALKNYYEKREYQLNNKKNDYDFSLETVLRFLKLETHSPYKDLLEDSLYEIYGCYSMKTATLQTLALNIGIYGGNIKMDSNIRNSLVFGVVHNEQEKNLASGNGLENISVKQE